jgi:diaminopimelate epimerase
VLWLKTPGDPASADVRMEVFNADGSVAETCGNGLRAVARYLHLHGPGPKPVYRIETLAGVSEARIESDGDVSIDMGIPVFGAADEALSVPGFAGKFTEVSVGNPHAVFVLPKGLAKFALEEVGPKIEGLPRFPQRTNVEFVEIAGPSSLRCRVWERGAGATLACGTGACAAAVAALRAELVKGPVEVHLPGGMLEIRWTPGGSVWMKGPAEEVFCGDYFQKPPGG